MANEFGTDKNPSGMFNIWGRIPGTKPPPEFRRMYTGGILDVVTYATKPEAIKAVLPPPLEPIPDFPPMISAVMLTNTSFTLTDARSYPYAEFGFWIPCQYKEHMGLNLLFMYLDGPGHDIGIVSGREMTGFMKRHAHIHLYRRGNRTNYTCVREGVPLVTVQLDVKEEISVEETGFGQLDKILNVREIPTPDFTGYTVREVIACDASRDADWMQISKVFSAEGSITLGHLEQEPVDILEVLEMGPAFQIHFQSKEGVSEFKNWVIEDLLK